MSHIALAQERPLIYGNKNTICRFFYVMGFHIANLPNQDTKETLKYNKQVGGNSSFGVCSLSI